MTVTQSELWELAVASRLLSPSACSQLQDRFRQVKGAVDQANARTLCEWLVTNKILTRYHASILLAGRPGPFDFVDYRVYGKLETGRLAGMFRAVHRPTKHSTTLQFLTGGNWEDRQTWSDVGDRVAKLSRLDSPQLLRCFELVDSGEYKFIVYDKRRGKSLESHLQEARAVRAPVACRWIQQLARVMGQIHDARFFVGDLCSASVFVEPSDGSGIRLFIDAAHPAGPLASDASRNEREMLRFDYSAPELGQSGRTPDCLTDIYALGCVFYEMLSGRVPVFGGDSRDKMRRHASEPIQPLENFGVAEGIAQVVATMLAKNPSVRVQDSARIVELLEPFIEPHAFPPGTFQQPPTLKSFVTAIRQRVAGPGSRVTTATEPATTTLGVSDEPPPTPSTFDPPSNSHVGIVPNIVTESDGRARVGFRGRGQRSSHRFRWMLGGAGAGFVAIVVSLGVYWSGGFNRPHVENNVDWSDDDSRGSTIAKNDSISAAGVDDPRNSAPHDQSVHAAKHEVVPDDGVLLWASPTTGPVHRLQFVPPDAQLLMFARPSAIFATEEGRRVIQALGPEFQAVQSRWETSTGLQLSRVETVILGFHPDGGTQPRISMVVRLNQPVAGSVRSEWGVAIKAENDFGELYQVEGGTLLVPSATDEKTLVLGQSRDVSEVVQCKGAPPSLRREMVRLLERTDEDRHLTLLAAPNFFFAGGRSLFAANRAKIVDPLGWFLGDGIQAVSVSLHFEDHFYWEFRFAGQLDHPIHDLRDAVRQRMDRVPARVADYIFSFQAPRYWNQLSIRFPHMVEELRRFARFGVDGNHVVANGCLKLEAAHNLVLGCELAIASTPGVNLASDPPREMPDFQSVRDVLGQHAINIDFPQQSLEFALRDIAKEVKDGIPRLNFDFKIKIDGGGLEAEGITRNQQIREFKVTHQFVESALTQLLAQVSPELVWVVITQEETGQEIVLVTTKKTAQQNGYELPEPFRRKKT